MAAFARFAAVFIGGLVAAATIGKLVPHVQWMAMRFYVSLAASGFLVSAVMLAGVLCGPLLGVIVDRFGAKQVTLIGLAFEALASFALGHAESFAALAALRIAEGLGYSLAVVAGTVLVIDGATERRRSLALAVWSAFAPVGFALGQWLGSGVAANDPLPALGNGHAAVLLGVALLIALVSPRDPSGSRTVSRALFFAALRHAPALCTALAFGCSTALLLGAVALAPLVLAPASGLSVAETARLTALAALPGILGRFISGWLLGASARPIVLFVAASVAGSLFIVGALSGLAPFSAALVCFACFQICIGALPGIMSAMLPLVAPSPGQLGTVTGLANQMITAGNLIAPPLVLGVFALGGGAAAIGVLIAAVVASVLLVSGIDVYRKPLAAGSRS